MNIQTALFHLNTMDISSSVALDDYPISNQYGTINAIKTDYTWYNVDFKTILGDMYDSHDKFKVELCSASFSEVDAYGTTLNDKNVSLNIYGLPFSNCTYDTKTNTNLSSLNMGSMTLTQLIAGQVYFTVIPTFTIRSPTSPCNIRIRLSTIDGITAPATGANTLFPHMCFYFRVTGVDAK